MKISHALLGLLLGGAGLAEAAAPPPTGPASAKPAARGDDEKAIQAATAAFVKAYNAGDVKAIAALYTEDAENVDEDGNVIRGRSAIADQFTQAFADDPGGKIAVRAESIRFLGADVAKEEGRSTTTPGQGGPPESDRYTVLFLKQGGRWLQAYVREHGDSEIAPHDRLKELEWMIGQWVDESPEAVISTDCRWSDDKNFLLRSYTIQVAGVPAMSGVQRVGWDPITGQIKSWVFDSQGGHSEGLWSRDGNRWAVKLAGPLHDGKIFTETNVFTVVNKDRVLWKSIDRTEHGQVVPDVGEFVMVRKPPLPQHKVTTRPIQPTRGSTQVEASRRHPR